jgi:hypothetical protein
LGRLNLPSFFFYFEGSIDDRIFSFFISYVVEIKAERKSIEDKGRCIMVVRMRAHSGPPSEMCIMGCNGGPAVDRRGHWGKKTG